MRISLCYAMKLRAQALLKVVEPQSLCSDHLAIFHPLVPWKTDIVTTIFWIGEQATANNPVPNHKSSWDADWARNYGGYDNPDASRRHDYIPISFVPRQNPFYCALPYNDVSHGQVSSPRRPRWFRGSGRHLSSRVIPFARTAGCAIRHGSRVCYAQWEDCGPFRTDHYQYVFRNERPKPNLNHGAGLDVSPAVRDYLGLGPLSVNDWQFAEVRDVPPGPCGENYGDNNNSSLSPGARPSGVWRERETAPKTKSKK